MTRKARMLFTEGWSALLQQVEAGKPMPAQLPERMEVHRIKLRPEVFQHRNPLQSESAAHIRELSAKAKASTDGLDPIKVWWDGKHWVCIDGHHRHQAYMQADMRREEVRVEVFEGSPQKALKEAAQANTKDKLQMRKAEKTTAAWHLVVAASDGLTQGEQAEASGISRRMVVTMHGVKRILLAKGVPDIGDLSWGKARQLAAGEDSQPEHDADWIEEQARKVAEKLHRHIGIKAASQAEVFARALEVFSPRLVADLTDYWRDQDGDDE